MARSDDVPFSNPEFKIDGSYDHKFGEAITAIINGANGLLWWDFPPNIDRCGWGECICKDENNDCKIDANYDCQKMELENGDFEMCYNGGKNAYELHIDKIKKMTIIFDSVKDALVGEKLGGVDFGQVITDTYYDPHLFKYNLENTLYDVQYLIKEGNERFVIFIVNTATNPIKKQIVFPKPGPNYIINEINKETLNEEFITETLPSQGTFFITLNPGEAKILIINK